MRREFEQDGNSIIDVVLPIILLLGWLGGLLYAVLKVLGVL